MCAPSRPQPDHYDRIPQVKPHFCQGPGLTPIPRGHRYNRAPGDSVADAIKDDIAKLYRKHGLKVCSRHGLYWAGSEEYKKDRDNDLTMILVIELIHPEMHRWRELDPAAREILNIHGLDGIHGVCHRFYEFWRNPTDYVIEPGNDTEVETERTGIWRYAQTSRRSAVAAERARARARRSVLPPRRVNGTLFSGPVAEALTMPHPALRQTTGGLHTSRQDADPVRVAAQLDGLDDEIDFGVGEVLDHWGPLE